MINNEKEKGRFNNLMNTFADVFGKATTPMKNRIYFDFLIEFPIEFLETAAKRLLDKKKISTFPTIAEWRECCWEPEEAVRELALQAWHGLEKHYVALTIPSDPKALAAIIRVFGSWGHFKAGDKGRDHWDKMDFVAAYLRVYREDEEAKLEAGMSIAQLEAARKRLTEEKKNGD